MRMKKVLPTIVLSQFFCTSVWFAVNAVIGDIVKQLHTAPDYLAQLASIVIVGFISGTLVFAVLSIADRFSPTKVFFVSAIVAAVFNLAVCINGIDTAELLLFRFLTGFFIAGIYPVGMKIAADHYEQGLGRSLGFLVGALVLGTSFPHLLKSMTMSLPWKYVIYCTSSFCLLGGLAMLLLVRDGPHRKRGTGISLAAFLQGFRISNFRAAALGYTGHMWELYAFWVFLPLMLSNYKHHFPAANFSVPLLSFLIISSGSLACVAGGLLSQRLGEKRVATAALFLSGICCVVSPLILLNSNETAFLVFLFVWGIVVIADSPLFSTLIAKNAPAEIKGSLLTIANCVGFSVTIVSIQLINALKTDENSWYIYVLLGIGPALGLIALFNNKQSPQNPIK